MSRKMARETAMKLLYQADMNELNTDEVLRNFYEESDESKNLSSEDSQYVEQCVTGTIKNLKEIDNLIESNSKEWKISRIAKVDLAIMRLSIYEMNYMTNIPRAVSVNEAIELAKKFSGENSSVFVNGVLGNIIRELTPNA